MSETEPQPPAWDGSGYQPAPPPPWGPPPGPDPGQPWTPGLPYGPPPRRGTNTMAILGLVFAFVFSPLGIVFGAIGLKQTRERGEEGRGLALAGVIVGSVFTALSLVMIIVVSVAASSAVSSLNTSEAQLSSALASATPDVVTTPDAGGTDSGVPGTSTDGAGASTQPQSSDAADLAECQELEPALATAESQLAPGSTASPTDVVHNLYGDLYHVLDDAKGTGASADFQSQIGTFESDAAPLGNGDPAATLSALQRLAAPLDAHCASVGYHP